MERNAINEALLNALVERGLNDIEHDPHRSIRKIADLGAHLARGRFQRHFLSLASTMLADDSSPYYSLCENIVRTTRRDALKHFGIALGFHSWTCGAASIRKQEAQSGREIPWMITCRLNSQEAVRSLSSLVQQGQALGVFSYALIAEEGTPLSAVFEVIEAYPDCAFSLLLSPETLTIPILEQISECTNLLTLVRAIPEQWQKALRALAEQGSPRALYLPYSSAADVRELLKEEYCGESEEYESGLLFFVAQAGCTAKETAAVQEMVTSFRTAPTVPWFPVNFYTDMLTIDRIISSGGCLMCFEGADVQIYANDHWISMGASDDLASLLPQRNVG